MKIQLISSLHQDANEILIPFAKINIDQSIIAMYSGLDFAIEFYGAAKEVVSFLNPKTKQKICLLGLGDEKETAKTNAILRSFLFSKKSSSVINLNVILGHLDDDYILNAVLGIKLATVNHGVFKTESKNEGVLNVKVEVGSAKQNILQTAQHIADSQISVMGLVDMPSNIKTPLFIAEYAKKSGKQFGYDVTIMEKDQLQELGMDALLAVGQGSIHPPAMILMEYKPKNANSTHPKIGLVGKGISFDTGGISIKSSTNMGYMKSDMGGAAAVIGTLELIAKLQLDVHVVGIVPAAENSVDANSIRPGDVISSYSGKSIEVIDTDAEGRLVLADGLAYMLKHYDPEYLVDIATLTGSCILTLGYHAAGLFTKNDQMAQDISEVGYSVNEKVWRFPMWDEYFTDMHSDIADVKNLSGKPVSGAITAAKFVEYFTENHPKWAHLDIAGVAFSDSEYTKMRASTAFGIRLLTSYIQKLIS